MHVGSIARRNFGRRATALRAALACALAVATLLSFTSTSEAQRRRGRAAREAAAARAESAEVTRARELFREGVAFVQAHELGDAEARFREALTLHDAPAIHFNLASVLFERGRYPEASAENERALGAADLPDAVRGPAEELRAAIANGAAMVEFSRQGDAVTGALAVDGFLIVDDTVAIPVAPGAHVATVTEGEREVARREFDVVAGARRTIMLGELPIAILPPPPATPVEDEPWFWPVIAGGAAIVVAVGVGVGIAAASGPEGPVQGNFTPGVIQWH